VGVIDWEFTYAAPVKFSYAPPWWLLIKRPEYWKKGIEVWLETCSKGLETFHTAMKGRECFVIVEVWLTEDQRLSDHMLQRSGNGDSWLMYAAKDSFAFDEIYWPMIDRPFFGEVCKSRGIDPLFITSLSEMGFICGKMHYISMWPISLRYI
jgi:hypothetical protein